MTDTTANSAFPEAGAQTTFRPRASSLPSSERCFPPEPAPRCKSTPPALSSLMEPCIPLLASQMISTQSDSHEQAATVVSEDQNVDKPDADVDATRDTSTDIELPKESAPTGIHEAQNDQIELSNDTQVASLVPHIQESLNKIAITVSSAPHSPELPLLQTTRRAPSPPVEILAVRPVRLNDAGHIPNGILPNRPGQSAISERCTVRNGTESFSTYPVQTCNGAAATPSEAPASTGSPGKRPISPVQETPVKKLKLEEPNVTTPPGHNEQDDTVEFVAARPVRPSSKRCPIKTTSSHPNKRLNSTTPNSPPVTAVLRLCPPCSWTSAQYAALAQTCYFSFPFQEFESQTGKSREDIAEVFAAVIQAPLLSRSDLGERRVADRRQLGQDVSEMHRQYQELYERDMQREREQMRQSAEAEVWRKMHREGWVKLEQAKSMLADTERQIEEVNAQAQQALNGPGRRGPRVKTVEEATEELQAASAELEKAKKAEQRKAKRNEKKESQGQGRGGKKGKCIDDTPSKPGPKSGYGKGKNI